MRMRRITLYGIVRKYGRIGYRNVACHGLSRHSGPHAPRGVDGPRNKAQRGEEQEGPAHSPHAPRTLHATGRGAVRIPKTVL